MKIKKRQVLPPGLWVTATPIGNLGDLTERALQALESADAVLCEDTRRTSQLLSSLGLSRRLERLDAHASDSKLAHVVQAMVEGKSFALVTDAGTPAISDPGGRLVRLARLAGVRVTPVPGASAVMALLSAAGFEETAFCFRGFFPRKTKEIEAELEAAASSRVSSVFVWFEAPARVRESLEVLARVAPDARVVAAKELTKLHERILSGDAREAAEAVALEVKDEGERGEWCFAVRFAPRAAPGEAESSDWVKALRCLLEEGVSPSNSAKRVTQAYGIGKKIVYEMALTLSGKKS
jgi:16S rRNA (cytidine1402-2'-O)-methyltransferase